MISPGVSWWPPPFFSFFSLFFFGSKDKTARVTEFLSSGRQVFPFKSSKKRAGVQPSSTILDDKLLFPRRGRVAGFVALSSPKGSESSRKDKDHFHQNRMFVLWPQIVRPKYNHAISAKNVGGTVRVASVHGKRSSSLRKAFDFFVWIKHINLGPLFLLFLPLAKSTPIFSPRGPSIEFLSAQMDPLMPKPATRHGWHLPTIAIGAVTLYSGTEDYVLLLFLSPIFLNAHGSTKIYRLIILSFGMVLGIRTHF